MQMLSVTPRQRLLSPAIFSLSGSPADHLPPDMESSLPIQHLSLL